MSVLKLDDHTDLYVKHVSSKKNGLIVSNDSFSKYLYGNCNINYHDEVIELHFINFEFHWNLKNIVIFYKKSKIEEKSFGEGGFSAQGTCSYKISFCIDIKDLNIQYYDSSEKDITFNLDFSDDQGNCYSSKYSIEFPVVKFQVPWKFSFLGFFHPKETICGVFKKNFTLALCETEKEKTLCEELENFRNTPPAERFEKNDYVKFQRLMLNIEDLTVKKAVSSYTLLNEKISRVGISCRLYCVNHTKDIPSNLGLNHVVLTTMELYEKYKDKLWEIENSRCFNRIQKIEENRIIFEKSKSCGALSTNQLYHIEFVENRVPFRLSHEILDLVTSLKLDEFFKVFDVKSLRHQGQILKDSNNNATKARDKIEIKSWSNVNVGKNREQQRAVENIVNCSSFPLPYVIFGPPGTGKTSTLVEAVAQIIKLKPNAHVLVTANSNSACDEIGIRLLNYVGRHEIFRFYSPSFERPEKIDRLHPQLKPLSNFKTSLNEFPTYEEIYFYKIVVCSLVNCGRMITANLKKNHFDYILIDECASTLEATSIIPIVGLGCERGRVNANIVLSGDHKQLGPMLHSFYNERCGYDMSLMERLMSTEKYSKYPFDANYVTQLSENYRSHWSIIHFSNVQFYHSQLRAKQSKEIANFACGWEKLPNKRFPLIFHSTLSPSETQETSLYNRKEIEIVTSYVKLLLQGINGKKVEESDIAIISPYRAQRMMLQDRFKIHPGIEIGTVDYYQGREKKIVIFSTVRSQTPTIGFLRNEKRMNVALTRAKSLLIVVGNGETLQKNKLWYKFINFCSMNGALVGEPFMLRYRKKKEKAPDAVVADVPKRIPIKPISLSPIKEAESESESDNNSDDSLIHEDEKVLCKTIAVNDKKFKKKQSQKNDLFYREQFDGDGDEVDLFYCPEPDTDDDYEVEEEEEEEAPTCSLNVGRIKIIDPKSPLENLMRKIVNQEASKNISNGSPESDGSDEEEMKEGEGNEMKEDVTGNYEIEEVEEETIEGEGNELKEVDETERIEEDQKEAEKETKEGESNKMKEVEGTERTEEDHEEVNEQGDGNEMKEDVAPQVAPEEENVDQDVITIADDTIVSISSEDSFELANSQPSEDEAEFLDTNQNSSLTLSTFETFDLMDTSEEEHSFHFCLNDGSNSPCNLDYLESMLETADSIHTAVYDSTQTSSFDLSSTQEVIHEIDLLTETVLTSRASEGAVETAILKEAIATEDVEDFSDLADLFDENLDRETSYHSAHGSENSSSTEEVLAAIDSLTEVILETSEDIKELLLSLEEPTDNVEDFPCLENLFDENFICFDRGSEVSYQSAQESFDTEPELAVFNNIKIACDEVKRDIDDVKNCAKDLLKM